MNAMTGSNHPVRRIGSRQILGVVLGTAALLLIPFVAMQFTREVNWTAGDFVVAAVLLAGTGMLFELAVNKITTSKGRVLAGLAIALGFLFVWAELAVGIVGSPFAGS